MKQIWPRNHLKGQAVQCFPLTRIIAFSGCLERSQVFKAHVKSLNQISPNVASVRRCLPSTHTLLNSSTLMPSWSPKHLAATRMCLELVCDTVTNIHVYLLPLYINQTFFFLPMKWLHSFPVGFSCQHSGSPPFTCTGRMRFSGLLRSGMVMYFHINVSIHAYCGQWLPWRVWATTEAVWGVPVDQAEMWV